MDLKMNTFTERLCAIKTELQSIIELSSELNTITTTTTTTTGKEKVSLSDVEDLHSLLDETERKLKNIMQRSDIWTQQKQSATRFFTRSRLYNIILADPPWKYRTPHWEGGTQGHYNTMSVKEMRKLPVLGLSSEDCVMLMWATWPKLEEAIALMRNWGFIYKTVFTVWVKQNRKSDRLAIGAGCYTRANTEFLLLGTRGHIVRYQQNDNFVGVYVSHKSRHSEKPLAIHDMIFDRFGDLPRIELFARCRQRGWDAWGNECGTQTEDKKEIMLKCRQDENSKLAYKTIRSPPGQVSIPKKYQSNENSRKRGKIYAQTIHVVNDYPEPQQKKCKK